MSTPELPKEIEEALVSLWNRVFVYADADEPSAALLSSARASSDAAKEAIAAVVKERDELSRWQREVAEGTGFINQAEGQAGCEVADPGVIVETFKAFERERDELRGLIRRAKQEMVSIYQSDPDNTPFAKKWLKDAEKALKECQT